MTADIDVAPVGRMAIPGAVSPFPLADHVPALLADDPMVVAFLSALDEVWAPIISTLDCFDAYLDPRLAPPDMVAYLGSWILAMIDQAQGEEQLREDVAMSHRTVATVGTTTVLHERLVPREAERVDVHDTGGIHTSIVPTDPRQWTSPGDATVVIDIFGPRDSSDQGAERLRRLIRELVPAHVPVRVQIG